MAYFVNNRQIVPELSINTGTSAAPEYTNLCCASEISVSTEVETDDFYVFCDALQRQIVTGANVGFDTTLKLDMQNKAVQDIIGKVHTLISEGTIEQFTNVQIQFQLLTGITENTLTYKTYTADANMSVEDLGGAAEESGEVSVHFQLIGTAKASA